jgi:preprotein translocase subunit SecY
MIDSNIEKYFSNRKLKITPNEKVIQSLLIIIGFNLVNQIPLGGVDQQALKASFSQLEPNNPIFQFINMYSAVGGTTILSPFSLGIIPYINASILIDLLTAIVPSLEKLQSEEGEIGRRKLKSYKKYLTLLFAIIQSLILINSLKGYFYDTGTLNLGLTLLLLTVSSMIVVWATEYIDNEGIGNGTSLIIFNNIIIGQLPKISFAVKEYNAFFFFQIILFAIIIILIALSQSARSNIEIVSARQLAFLEKSEQDRFNTQFVTNINLQENGLSIRLNQAGIFPIIIASNLLPFLSYLSQGLLTNNKVIGNILYYLLVLSFNYFYTTIFWDPEKISEQLRKSSVSVVDVRPGKDTVSYLERKVRSVAISGGISLCLILIIYDFLKALLNNSLLNQINISSLIILVGVCFELGKVIKGLFINNLLGEKVN